MMLSDDLLNQGLLLWSEHADPKTSIQVRILNPDKLQEALWIKVLEGVAPVTAGVPQIET
jgi:hypothetical protein